MTIIIRSQEYEDDPAEMDAEEYPSPEEDAAIFDEENEVKWYGYPEYSNEEWWAMDEAGVEPPDLDCCPENLVCESIKVQRTFIFDFLEKSRAGEDKD